MKYISKIESGSTRCWFVRVPRFVDGKKQHYNELPANKSFPALRHGGWKKALGLALEWRDQYLKEHNMEEALLQRYITIRGTMRNTGRNTSGIIGVHFGVSRKNGHERPYWTGITSEDNVIQHKTYACGRWGEIQAFKLACIYRFTHSGTLIVEDKLKLISKPPVDWYDKKTGRLYEKCPAQLREKYESIKKKYPFEK